MESSSSQKLAEKPSLITPSASPPPAKVSSAAPPAKRQRVSSTPRRTFGDSRDSRTPSVQDIEKSRADSLKRLFDKWNSLQRYVRDMDEDDIIDITTLDIVKDNGVLRGSKRIEFGQIHVSATGESSGDEGSDLSDADDEYGLDELDAFADTGTLENEPLLKHVPPLDVTNPIDAEALQEFEEAERRRKETCGSEGEESEVQVWDLTSLIGDESGGETLEEYGNTGPEGEEEDEGVNLPTESWRHFTDSDGSDDELGNWTVDESSIVYPVAKYEAHESEVEGLEPPPISSSPAPSSPVKPSSEPQLPSPPDSRSSAVNFSLKTPSSHQLPIVPPDETANDDLGRPGSYTPEANLPKEENRSPLKKINSSPRKPSVKPVVLVTPRNLLPRSRTEGQENPTKPRKMGTPLPQTKPAEIIDLSCEPSSDSQDEAGEHFTTKSVNNIRSRRAHDESPPNHSAGRKFARSNRSESSSPERPPKRLAKKRKRRPSDEDTTVGDDNQPPNGLNESKVDKGKGRSVSQARERPNDSPSRDRRYRSRRSPSESEDEGHSSSDPPKPPPRRSRSRSHFASDPHPYPYAPYHYPSHLPQPSMFSPIQDPRAQLIINQAMHQLSALVNGSWNPPPIYPDGPVPMTPSHRHRGKSPHPTYSTPTHHPHPYPYFFDPAFSNATMPPSSPEPSPEKPRAKTLVKRSKSRGRRVSFKLDNDGQDEYDSDVFGTRASSSKASPPRRREKTPGHRLVEKESISEEDNGHTSGSVVSDSEEGDRVLPSYVRGQTPGPSSSGTHKKSPKKSNKRS